MKPIFSFVFLILLSFGKEAPIITSGSDEITVCHDTSATALFANLANDSEFVEMHETPRALDFQTSSGEDIEFSTNGENGKGYLIKSATPTDKYLFVIHEWWGLNEHIKEQSQKLYNDLGNINILAIDLYDGKVAADAKQAGQFMGAVKTDRAEAIIKGAMAFAGNNAEIYTIGWCFGGGWSLQASILLGSQAKGAVMYYGMPERDVEKLKTLKVDVLGLWATERWINKDIITQFEENMKQADKTLFSYTYKSSHAFANPSQPSYNSEDATDAYEKTLAFFKERMEQ